MVLIDTHCHIHEALDHFDRESETRIRWQRADNLTPEAMIRAAADAEVKYLLCVGTSLADSALAVDFVQAHPGTLASIGIHPHEAQVHNCEHVLKRLRLLAGKPKVAAVGECGLDYYYNHSPKAIQEKLLRLQIELALEHNLPLVFHVREAFPDFWRIFDEYRSIRGVIHSFSADRTILDQILTRDLYIGLNGIMTFTKDPGQLDAARAVPLDRLVLETDAPFLTPAPYRGTICEPKHVRVTAEFLAKLRGESLNVLAESTTKNANKLFGFF